MSQPSLKIPFSQDSHAASFKEVRFSHPLVPVRRARSVASSNPYLDSAYQAARAANQASKENTFRDFSVFVDQSRSLLDSQRLHFERERLLFAEERKLWEMERSLLKSRIAELEAVVGGSKAQPYSNQFRSSFSLRGGGVSNTGLWQANRSSIPTTNGAQEHHVWEGPLPGSRRPTRVFPGEDDCDVRSALYLAPNEMNGFGLRSSLDAALSPQLFDRTGHISMPVPIEKVDSQLDGITLKSTALPPDVVAKVMTPPTSLSPTSSPPKDEPVPSKPASEGRSPFKLKLSDLGPPNENLVRNAGHTPMAILGTETEGSNISPTELVLGETEMGEEEAPLAPVVTKQPVENGDSYFPHMEVDEDPALKGPLTLENNEGTDSAFLSQLDQKLLNEAKKAIGGSFATEDDDDINSKDDTAGGDDDDDEPDPELKLKPSTNFGTAFGQC